jgi:hypothetical protein
VSEPAAAKPAALPKRPITEAVDEVHRELEVRKRIYGQWVAEGKISFADAKARGERMESALAYLLDHPLCPPGYTPAVQERPKAVCPF